MKQTMVGLLIGALGTIVILAGLYFFYEDNAETELIKPSNSLAEVEKRNGLFVFINSLPKCGDCYASIGNFNAEQFVEKLDDLGIGEQKAADVIGNIFNTTKKSINFSDKLSTITSEVNEQYPKAEGVIFHGRLNKCEVIEFKN